MEPLCGCELKINWDSKWSSGLNPLISLKVSRPSDKARAATTATRNILANWRTFDVQVAVQSGKLHLSGFFAWLAWAGIHIQFLGTANLKISVFMQWVWSYLTGQRGSRLIVNHHV